MERGRAWAVIALSLLAGACSSPPPRIASLDRHPANPEAAVLDHPLPPDLLRGELPPPAGGAAPDPHAGHSMPMSSMPGASPGDRPAATSQPTQPKEHRHDHR